MFVLGSMKGDDILSVTSEPSIIPSYDSIQLVGLCWTALNVVELCCEKYLMKQFATALFGSQRGYTVVSKAK